MNPKLIEIGTQLRTQDNRCTASPMFCVQVCRRIGPLMLEYCDDDKLMIHDHQDCYTYYPEHEEYAELFKLHKKDELPEHYTAGGYHDEWETVAVCFTEEGCKEHLEQNGHNYRHHYGIRIYAESFYRNPEMNAIRDFLISYQNH